MRILALAVVVCALVGYACSEPSKGPFTFKIKDIPEDARAGGEQFTVKITVSPTRAARDFRPSAYEFKLKYDPAVLRAEAFAEGGYIKGIGRTSICPELGNKIDNDKGEVWIACGSFPEGEKGDSTDELALITFSPIGGGTSALEFVDEEFADRLGESLLTKAQDGEIRVD